MLTAINLLALLVVCIFHQNDRTSWISIVKNLKSPQTILIRILVEKAADLAFPCYFIWGHDLASQFTLELKENLQQKVHNESNKRSHAPRQEAQGAACSGNCLLPLIQAVVKGVTIFLVETY